MSNKTLRGATWLEGCLRPSTAPVRASNSLGEVGYLPEVVARDSETQHRIRAPAGYAPEVSAQGDAVFVVRPPGVVTKLTTTNGAASPVGVGRTLRAHSLTTGGT